MAGGCKIIDFNLIPVQSKKSASFSEKDTTGALQRIVVLKRQAML